MCGSAGVPGPLTADRRDHLSMELRSAARTDVGRRRQANEDCFSVEPASGLYLVADGLGGFIVKPEIVVQERPVSIVAADFDTDGAMDLAVGHGVGRSVSIINGNGDGEFASPTELLVDDLVFAMAAATV